MKFFILAALVAAASASALVQAPGPRVSDQAPGPSEAETNAVLARAQHKVNYQALHYGAGVGTAPYYGVPGTDLKGVHNGAYGYGRNGAYNGAYNGGYGYGHGHNGGYNGGYGQAYNGAYGYGNGYYGGYGAAH